MAKKNSWKRCCTIARLVIAAAAMSGCAQIQTNNAENSSTRRQVEQDDANTQLMRGFQYVLGSSKDFGQAFAWFRKAADQGSAIGEYQVGQSYDIGRGVKNDQTEAVVWYRKAAEQGLPLARSRLRQMFVSGQLLPVDDDRGGQWWRELVEQAADESQAFYRAYATASQGDADAEVELGIAYLTGVGTLKDRTQAASLFQQAGEQGQPEAQCLFAALSASDDDWTIPTEAKHAADLCQNAANQGHADAQLVLSTFYLTGRGVPKDSAQAAAWLRKAAEQGRPDAQFIVAFDYQRGRGVSKDDAQSIVWLRKAADQGYPAAMTSLGLQASIAHMTGAKDPLGDPVLAQKFTDLGIEHSPDSTRDLLPNLWASRAQQEKDRQMQKQWSGVLAPALKAMGVDGR
ncbi:tetratricopeptide repeat protein (plasmid) [Paraburkholderia sp. PREW-6R]|uniref:tetratricopeptide repeat protein n=1 Tax=Paraburkholderia sp. PREW-6R TaxID=3141544 RepID=UPI0031F5B186